MLTGTIVENSLSDKSILSRVRVIKTYPLGDWTLHDIEVEDDKVAELAKYLADGPWYIHLWQPGSDDVTVVFKNKIFHIKHSDKSTWAETISYGQSLGIPAEQLDFPIS